MNRSDEGRQVKPGLGRSSRPNRDDDEDDMDGVTTADMGSNASGEEPDGDEMGDEKNETAPPHAMRDAVTNRRDQDAEEASEARQKSGNMGGRGMKGGQSDKIKGTEVSDSDEMSGPANKVEHGRKPLPGKAAPIEGAHQGSGDKDSSPRYWSNLGHGEREATISGAHQGQHKNSTDTDTDGGGFEGDGKLSRERAKGPSGTKR